MGGEFDVAQSWVSGMRKNMKKEGNINIGSIKDIRPWGGEFMHGSNNNQVPEAENTDSSPFDSHMNSSSPRGDPTAKRGGAFGGHGNNNNNNNNSPRGSNLSSMNSMGGNVGNIARMVDTSHRNMNSIASTNRAAKEWQYLTYSSSNLTPTKNKFPNDFFLIGARPIIKQPYH